MNSSFRLQITKEDKNFMVQSPDLLEVNENSLAVLQKDLESWKQDYSEHIEEGSQFFLKKEGKELILLQ